MPARRPRRWPTSTSSSARAWSRGSRRWSRCSTARSAGSRARPRVGEVRTVGLTAAVAFAPELLAADPGLPERAVGRGAAARGRDARPARPRPPDLAAVRDHRGRDRRRWSTAWARPSRTSPRSRRSGPRNRLHFPTTTVGPSRSLPPTRGVRRSEARVLQRTKHLPVPWAEWATAGEPVEGGPARGRPHLPDRQRSSRGSWTSSRDGCSSRSSARTSS